MSVPIPLLHEYDNGNCHVQLYGDGTKVRRHEGDAAPEFPESMDVKVTDYCDAGCRWCHEKSTVRGRHAGDDFSMFAGLPAGTEIAIGGGNPLDWPFLRPFMRERMLAGSVCNLTVNAVHVGDAVDSLNGLRRAGYFHGLGISYNPALIGQCLPAVDANTIFHLIMGVHVPDDLRDIMAVVPNAKVLLLGYKNYGRGAAFHSATVERQLRDWFTTIHEFLGKPELTVSFDNLGIEQMNIRRFFREQDWPSVFMGSDGQFTFYIDLVKREFCKSSTSAVRNPIGPTDDVRSMFGRIRENA